MIVNARDTVRLSTQFADATVAGEERTVITLAVLELEQIVLIMVNVTVPHMNASAKVGGEAMVVKFLTVLEILIA